MDDPPHQQRTDRGAAAALGVSTDDLLGGAPASDPRVRGEPITRDGLTMWPLTNRAAGGLRTFKIRITSRRRRPPPRSELRVHEGHDWKYVLDGRMRLILGEQDLIVEPGDAVEFSTNTPHWFGAIDGPVELIAVFGAHGERTHLHG